MLPTVGFLIVFVVADRFVDRVSLSWGDPVGFALYVGGFVTVASALPVVTARPGAIRIVATLVMTAVSAMAGALIITTDDAQAGFAVFWVAIVGLPLALALVVIDALTRHRLSVRPDPRSAG